MKKTILSASHLVKAYKAEAESFSEAISRLLRSQKTKSFRAVNNISFEIKEGEILGLLGPNGAGKTTTINMLLGLLKPTKGEIRIFGKDFSLFREEILEQMNFSSAYNELPYLLTVRENLTIFGRLYGVKNLKVRVEELIKVFELGELANKTQGTLSAGQKARLNLAKAFVNNPRLVLLDEPTASMDPDIADKVRKFLLETQKKFKTAILFTSHNMAEVEEVCDRVIFINKGKIIAEDTPDGLAKRIKNVKVNLRIKDGQKRTLSWARKNDWRANVSGRFVEIETTEEEIAWLLAGLAEENVEYNEIAIDKPTLEDFFLQEARNKSPK
ncbi:ABC transporter ATP-binding protein [Candidatus Microgenomates bacterium]|nr:ABC transporter ATP-binding protein [Candidatus Microgenomates bacterium]